MINTGKYKTEIISNTKIILGISGNSEDELLRFIVEDTVNLVLTYCRLDILPYQLYGLIPQIAASIYSAKKSGGIASVAEGDRRLEYRSASEIMKEYYERLAPFKAKLPSEVARNERMTGI